MIGSTRIIIASLAILLLTNGFGVFQLAYSASVIATIPVGLRPSGVGVDSDSNRIYVANTNGNSVSVIDGDTNTVTATITVGNGPYGVGVDSDSNRIYVVNTNDNSVSVIDGNTNTVTATITVGVEPYYVGVDSDSNRIYVTNYDDDTVSVINGDTNTVTATITVGNGPYPIGVDSDSNRIYTGDWNGHTVTVLSESADPTVPTSTSEQINGKMLRPDLFPPSIGVDPNNKRVVDYGFSYNGNPTQVEHFYTPYPLITANVGEQQVAELVIFENRGAEFLSHVELAFGLREGQILGESKAIILWDRNFLGEETVSTRDPENAIDKESLTIQSSKTKCLASSESEFCTKLVISHMFRAPLEFDIVGVTMWDDKQNRWQNTLNHGVHVQGKSLNPPAQYTVLDKRSLITITEIGKNAAVDDNGYLWTYDKSWQKQFIPAGKIDDGVTMHLFDRNHVRFDTYMKGQELLARNTLLENYPNYYDGSYSEINNIKMSPYYDWDKQSSINGKLQKSIEREIIKAEQRYEYLYGNLDRMVEK